MSSSLQQLLKELKFSYSLRRRDIFRCSCLSCFLGIALILASAKKNVDFRGLPFPFFAAYEHGASCTPNGQSKGEDEMLQNPMRSTVVSYLRIHDSFFACHQACKIFSQGTSLLSLFPVPRKVDGAWIWHKLVEFLSRRAWSVASATDEARVVF